MTVLDIEKITFSYEKRKTIFQDFSLKINKGEVVSIVGESGSGKSTLFDLITGELFPKKGSIKVGKVAQIYQDPYTSFHQSFSIIEQIKDVATIENLDFWLDKISFDKKLLFQKPHQLSGGQLQRASILRVLLMKPDLVLADEPTSALDNVIQLEVMQLLLSLLENFALVVVTHDKDLATWCSDRIITQNLFK